MPRIDNRTGNKFRKLLAPQMEGGMESDSVRKSRRMLTALRVSISNFPCLLVFYMAGLGTYMVAR